MRFDYIKQHRKILKQASKNKYIQVNIVPFWRVTVRGDVPTSNSAAFEHNIIGK